MSGRTLLLLSLAASVASLNLAPRSEVARPLCNLPRDGGRRSWLASAAAAAATTTLLPVAAHADGSPAFGGMQLSTEQDSEADKLMKRMASTEARLSAIAWRGFAVVLFCCCECGRPEGASREQDNALLLDGVTRALTHALTR